MNQMKLMYNLLILATIFLLTACGKPPTAKEPPNKFTLPDGTPVEMYKIDRGGDQSHYIYIVRGKDSVSNNYNVHKRGNQVNVLIDGREYQPIEKTK